LSDWNPDKFMTYQFVSDFAVIMFTVPGMQDWDEEMFDSAAEDDLASYVKEPEAFYMDDSWDKV